MRFSTLGQFWINLPVSIKGPLTICIPIASTVLIAIALWSLDSQLERAQELVLHSARVQSEARRIQTASADLARAVNSWRITGSRQFLAGFEPDAADLLARSTGLMALIRDPALDQDASGIHSLMKSEIAAFRAEIGQNPAPAARSPAPNAIETILDNDQRLEMVQSRLRRFLNA